MKARIKTAQDERDELIKDVMGMSDADLRAWKRSSGRMGADVLAWERGVTMDAEGRVHFAPWRKK